MKATLSVIARSILGALFFFLLPITIVICTVLIVHTYFPGFWPETIAAIAVGITSLLIANREAVRSRDESPVIKWVTTRAIVLRNILITSAVATMLMLPANSNNHNQNDFGIVLWIIAVAAAVVVISVLVSNGELKDMFEELDDFLSGLSRLITLFVAVGLLGEMYVHFGTQFIWLPVIVLCVLVMALYEDPSIYYKDTEDFLQIVAPIISLAIAVISTIYQFWFYKIVFGYVLWQVLLAIVATAILIGLVFFVLWLIATADMKRTNREIALKKKAEEEKLKQEAENQKKEKAKSIATSLQTIQDAEKPSWYDIIAVYRHDKSNLSKVLPKLHLAQLQELVTISTFKEHIVWGGYFQEALQIMEEFAKKSYKDDELEILVKQANELLQLISKYESYAGYNEIMIEVDANCPTIFNIWKTY